MKAHSVSRIRLISFIIFLFALLLFYKLYTLQIVHGSDYTEKAQRQYAPSASLFDRGSIFFQTKDGDEVSAATLQNGFTVAVNPKNITDAEAAYEKINSIVPLDKDTFLAKATKKDDTYEEVLKKVPQDQGTAIDALHIPGVSLYTDKWRYYPGNSMAAQVLGFVGSNGSTLAGRYGLESYYDDTLDRSNENLNQNFFAQIFSDFNTTVVDNSKAEGDIVSTIEPSVETYLEKELESIKAEWSPTVAGGIIINPTNGEIYAMAADPTFDPNSFNTEKDPGVYANPLVENVYEMGSIIKALTMAAGLDSGAVTASTTYNDTGFITLNGSKISNYDGKARGVIPMQQVLNQSLNVGAAFVEHTMGNDVFSEYMKNYGLGEETGIDLPNEAVGLLDNLNSPRDVEHATASFGQGIALTPIATMRALSSLANGGTLINPHVVKSIKYEIGTTKEPFDNSEQKRVIKESTSKEITRMLVNVVDVALKNGAVKFPHYSVAAKTGTAQIADSATKSYYSDRFLHSFFGYFPAYQPKFLVFLYMVYPKNVQYASETLTDPFIDITKFLINYYEIPPDR